MLQLAYLLQCLPMTASPEPLLEFRKTLEFLLAFKNHITKLAANITKRHTRRNSIDDNFGRLKQPSGDNDDVNSWTRGTWYTTHRDNGQSLAIPDHLFGLSRPTPFLEKLLLLSGDNEDNDTEAEDSSFEDNGDVYGFIRTESGWFNKYTKETHTTHPLYDN